MAHSIASPISPRNGLFVTKRTSDANASCIEFDLLSSPQMEWLRPTAALQLTKAGGRVSLLIPLEGIIIHGLCSAEIYLERVPALSCGPQRYISIIVNHASNFGNKRRFSDVPQTCSIEIVYERRNGSQLTVTCNHK